ncbi:hypothetical protein [Aliivibrio fischeri]|uniref:hypothetical protein n=1 Tax=Aliivibrio fischeri TaxID=668 RepID=UPI00080E8C14|nr:hypothetical protein [Aliivibrio fischeri]OCH48168.1 hypothetical protein A6E02_08555 [Aliivibrio fischeri]
MLKKTIILSLVTISAFTSMTASASMTEGELFNTICNSQGGAVESSSNAIFSLNPALGSNENVFLTFGDINNPINVSQQFPAVQEVLKKSDLNEGRQYQFCIQGKNVTMFTTAQ